MLELLGLMGIVYNIASNCELRACSGNELEFVLDENSAALFNDGHAGKIRMALENYFGVGLSVSVTPGELASETPAMIATRRAAERQAAAVVAIEADPLLQGLIASFDGELDRASIVPLEP